MRKLERRWYSKKHDWVTFPLIPFSWLFGGIVKLRRRSYRNNTHKISQFPVPVIVVGNITVGGTGKTPFVIWLAKFLKSQGWMPGIVSRGVGGKQKCSPRWVEKNSNPKIVGDEAVLLAQRSDCPVVIGVNRVAAIQELLSKTPCNIVISDDGLQHYKMGRDLEIALLDGGRGLGNESLLPAGPLREPKKRLSEVDFVVYQTTMALPEERQQGSFAMQLSGNILVSVHDDQLKVPLNHFQQATVHAVAAIGNPQRFFAELRKAGLTLIEHVFPDHYLYEASDFAFKDDLPIIMTEKDAVKCQRFSDERFWCLPVEMEIDANFVDQLLKRINLLTPPPIC
jgi:tetraacyldisaccharide 4'-kinase